VLPEWAEETYPLYAYHHSARLQSAKVRAFLEFVVALTREPFGIEALPLRRTPAQRAGE
jgi:DNA-binding transcriptional LysR family regulator